jgi:hypothetical protein
MTIPSYIIVLPQQNSARWQQRHLQPLDENTNSEFSAQCDETWTEGGGVRKAADLGESMHSHNNINIVRANRRILF